MQTEFTESELLADDDLEAPLIADGVRCHGGFDGEGRYCLTADEEPVAGHRGVGGAAGGAVLHTDPRRAPRVLARELPQRGPVEVPDRPRCSRARPSAPSPASGPSRASGSCSATSPSPTSSGASTRTSPARPSPTSTTGCSRPTPGTSPGSATWPVTTGCGSWPGTSPSSTRSPTTRPPACWPAWGSTPHPSRPSRPPACRRQALERRVLPDDIDFTLEMMVGRMIGLLLIEISAFHGFRWAEEVLGDADLVAGDGRAATLVSYIRSDETPHVAWLRTALSEMRDRTWVGSRWNAARRHRHDRPAVGPRPRGLAVASAARRTSTSPWARSRRPWPVDPTPATSSRRCSPSGRWSVWPTGRGRPGRHLGRLG